LWELLRIEGIAWLAQRIHTTEFRKEKREERGTKKKKGMRGEK
jgi:hypothetical protein